MTDSNNIEGRLRRAFGVVADSPVESAAAGPRVVGGRVVSIGVVLAVAAAAVGLGVAYGPGSSNPSGKVVHEPPTPTSPAPTSTTIPPPVQPPAGTAVPRGFFPGSVSFVSSTTGFVIGIDSSCAAGACVALARTTDGGSSWVALPTPSAGYVAGGQTGTPTVPVVSEVRFADELDGWIFGPALFSTHDGGASWQRVDLGGSVVSLEASGGYVDAVVSPCSTGNQCTGPLELYQAPATGDTFTQVLTGPSVVSFGQVSPSLTLHSPAGFVTMSGVSYDNQQPSIYGTSNLAAGIGSWKAFPDPCASAVPGGGITFVSFAAPDATHLWTLCAGQGGAGSASMEVVKTANGVSSVAGTPPYGGNPLAVTATASGTIVVAAASGASELYLSTDGGNSWTTAADYSDGGAGFNDLGFTTGTQGVVIHGLPGPSAPAGSELLMTTNGGNTWIAKAITGH